MLPRIAQHATRAAARAAPRSVGLSNFLILVQPYQISRKISLDFSQDHWRLGSPVPLWTLGPLLVKLEPYLSLIGDPSVSI